MLDRARFEHDAAEVDRVAQRRDPALRDRVGAHHLPASFRRVDRAWRTGRQPAGMVGVAVRQHDRIRSQSLDAAEPVGTAVDEDPGPLVDDDERAMAMVRARFPDDVSARPGEDQPHRTGLTEASRDGMICINAAARNSWPLLGDSRERVMDVIEAIYQRRSVRNYKVDPVAPPLLDTLVSAAVQAPSAMNLQPWAFIVIESRMRLSRYAEHAKRHLLDRLAPGSPLYHYRDLLSDPGFDIFYGAPALVVVAATSNAAQSIEDCCMAAQNLMLAAHHEGLGTCCIGFARPWLNLSETKAELGISDTYVPVLAIVVGYPSTATPPVPRRRPELHRVGSEGREAATGEPREPGPSLFEEPAPTRTPSLEVCGPLGEDAPGAADLDGVP